VIVVLSRNNAANSRRSATALAVLHNFRWLWGWLWLVMGWRLIRDAAELAAIGLLKASDILKDAASEALPVVNPHPENTPDWRNWSRRHTGSFEGFYLDDEERATRLRQLRT
jgi:hypothetical protein